ncbi:MAG: glycosyltransferase [Bacteroides sp.]|nr:glycosyltransferase [Bacteroides sp.]
MILQKNIMIFPTILNVEDFIFFRYAHKLGYKIIFDQVETSYIADGTDESFKRKCYISFCEFISDYAYKKAAGSFVISEALLRQNKSKYPSMPLCLLPNSTPTFYGMPKTTIGSPIKILYSGTYALKDGVSFLIEGVEKAVQAGCKCELILVGKGRVRDMAFLDKIKDFSWIKYLGFISDEELYIKMRECDILAMTRTNSKFANFGFPFKLSEYLSIGNVVMATEVGDVPLYLNENNSLLIPPEDSNAIASAILYVSENPVKSLQIGRNGLNTMKEKFSIERIGEIFISFLSKI